ncbi:MAG: NADP-dependent isocitrate dehydrogenase [Syntrophorhabdaceae bacterium]|nr:NADP-dependent isocitrate dehydrogenase [Syntrophorhabdaceae bacterium]
MTEIIEIPYIAGDGTGEDIWNASKEPLEEAVIKAYGGDKRISWIEMLAGEKALEKTGKLIPEETLDTIRRYKTVIKGPLTTPVGGGYRSINVYLRQIFDLYVCVRPIRYFKGLPSPLKRPEKIDMVILRENTEDLYKGIEWKAWTDEAKKVIKFLGEEMGVSLSEDYAIGVKPISKPGTVRFTRWGIDYAIKNKRRSITVVHKGNIMKYTEGGFRDWAYEVAGEYRDYISFSGEEGKILFNDRIADNMFMQAILRPGDYDVLLCPNLNGDYLSDACAGLIGGLGVAPGANIGDNVAIFEPTHGSAPKYAGKDVINPISFLQSAAMMFSYMGLDRASTILTTAIEDTVNEGIMTYDLARQMEGIVPVRCSEFGMEVAKRIKGL